MESVSQAADDGDPSLTEESQSQACVEMISTSDYDDIVTEISRDEDITEPLVKKPRLETEMMEVIDVDADDNSGCVRDSAASPSDRRRNKSTSAAVLLGLVRSRVRKLAAQRRDTAAESSSADAPNSPSSPMTSPNVSHARTKSSQSDWIKPFNLGKLLSFTCLQQ